MGTTENLSETEDRARPSKNGGFQVVGVGASAGGLEAFTQLVRHLPLRTGMAFVLVQHLDPEHESALTQILSRATSLPVLEITDGQVLQPDHVYVIPPNTNLEIRQGVLRLQPRKSGRAPHLPIDAFFESLAADQGERSIGIVLSGTASDGTRGLEAIKAEGGITFAQDDSAKHDSMPRSAITAGCVDLVLAPPEIAKELGRIAKHPFVIGAHRFQASRQGEEDHAEAVEHQDGDSALPSGGTGTQATDSTQARAAASRGREPKAAEDGFKRVMLLLRRHSGVDFSLYKSTTIRRRIARRVILTKQNTLQDYARFLGDNSQELDSLFSDVLISVTSFFRNPEAFDALQREVFPKLLTRRGDEPVRCWVLGCSTGQEAYSLAISFMEVAEKAPTARHLQIFATDLNGKLLEKARQGLYSKSLAQDISPERLRRFFVEGEGGYRVSKSLRETVVFARQNFIADPPFSRMDLISCRNLLIYLDPSLQKKALPTFHYALKPDGVLVLGASESIGEFTDLFEPLNRKQKIYSKKPVRTSGPHLPERAPSDGSGSRGKTLLPLPPPVGAEPQETVPSDLSAQREADRIAIDQFAPPGVLINSELQVLQFRGQTGAYLEPPAGKATFDILKMARDGLVLPLRAAIHEAKRENKPARVENVRVQREDETRTIRLEVIPLKNLRDPCYLVLFEDPQAFGSRVSGPKLATAPRAGKEHESQRIADLESDLAEMRDYLKSLQDAHEATNEELQGSNEEVQSANEELQSINEELEVSKEELESANEELITVNEEMSHRNAELNRLNNDWINLQKSTHLPIVLLGPDLTIRRFSPQAEKKFDLRVTDVGRPIGHIRLNLSVGADDQTSPLDLESMSAQTMATVHEEEREVRDLAGRWYSLRARPYMTLDNRVDGVVLVLVDIDTLKLSEQEIRRKEELLRETHAKLQEHADELTRFNDVAVGREMRMIELKKEINELCRRVGEAPRYPLEFDAEGEDR